MDEMEDTMHSYFVDRRKKIRQELNSKFNNTSTERKLIDGFRFTFI